MNQRKIYGRIGEIIRARRDKLDKMTQETLARRVGMSRASLANIETGRQSILVHQLYALAKELDLKPADLLPDAGRTGDPDTPLPLPEDLKPLQKEQVSRLFAAPTAEPEEREERRAKPTKR